MLRGAKKLGFKFTLTMASYNLIRICRSFRGRRMSHNQASETSGRPLITLPISYQTGFKNWINARLTANFSNLLSLF